MQAYTFSACELGAKAPFYEVLVLGLVVRSAGMRDCTVKNESYALDLAVQRLRTKATASCVLQMRKDEDLRMQCTVNYGSRTVEYEALYLGTRGLLDDARADENGVFDSINNALDAACECLRDNV